MPERTIYVKEHHHALWDKAKELVGEESMSEIAAAALQQVIITMEAAPSDFEEIALEVGEYNAGHTIKFQGCQLAITKTNQASYLTSKGKLLLYLGHDISRDLAWAEYRLCDNIAEAAEQVDYHGDPLFEKALLIDTGVEIDDPYIQRLDI